MSNSSPLPLCIYSFLICLVIHDDDDDYCDYTVLYWIKMWCLYCHYNVLFGDTCGGVYWSCTGGCVSIMYLFWGVYCMSPCVFCGVLWNVLVPERLFSLARGGSSGFCGSSIDDANVPINCHCKHGNTLGNLNKCHWNLLKYYYQHENTLANLNKYHRSLLNDHYQQKTPLQTLITPTRSLKTSLD